MRKYNIEIPLYQNELEVPLLQFMQDDIGGSITIKLLDKDLSCFNLSDCSASVVFEKANKEIIQKSVTISENELLLSIESSIINFPGKVKTQLRVYKDSQRVTSHIFNIVSKKILDFEGAVEEYDKFDIIKTVLVLEDCVSNLTTVTDEIKHSVNSLENSTLNIASKLEEVSNFTVEINESITNVAKDLDDSKNALNLEIVEINESITNVAKDLDDSKNALNLEIVEINESIDSTKEDISSFETYTKDELNRKENADKKDAPGGYPSLNMECKIHASQIPDLINYPTIIISEDEPQLSNMRPGTLWLQPQKVEE